MVAEQLSALVRPARVRARLGLSIAVLAVVLGPYCWTASHGTALAAPSIGQLGLAHFQNFRNAQDSLKHSHGNYRSSGS